MRGCRGRERVAPGKVSEEVFSEEIVITCVITLRGDVKGDGVWRGGCSCWGGGVKV